MNRPSRQAVNRVFCHDPDDRAVQLNTDSSPSVVASHGVAATANRQGEKRMSKCEVFNGAVPAGGAILATALQHVPVLAAQKKPRPDPIIIDGIFTQWVEIIPATRKAKADVVNAVAQMPWWAQPGPSHLCRDGTMHGQPSWVPAIRDATLPINGDYRNIRPGEYDLKRFYEHHPAPKDLTRKWLNDALARLEVRTSEREAECKRVGLPKLRRVLMKLEDRYYGLRNSVSWMGPSPYRLAFETLSDIARCADGDVPILTQAETTGNREFYDWIKILKDLLPILPLKMAEVTTRVLKTGAGPFRRVPIWIGRDERNPKHQFGLWRPAEAPNESVDAA